MKYCTRCILPDTRPGVLLDEQGVCAACRGKADIDWPARYRELENIVTATKAKQADYDCIVPVSGGKDSWYQVDTCKKLGMKVLGATWRTPLRTEIGEKNLRGLIENLKIDHLDISINPETERRFAKAAFAEKGAAGLPMHMAIFAIPTRLAVQLKIPLVVWGENPQLEFGGDTAARRATDLDVEWIRRYGVTNGTGVNDWVGHEGLTAADLAVYRLPTEAELTAYSPRSIFLGSFVPWDSFHNAAVAAQLGFQSGDDYRKTGVWNFADLDCRLIAIHHFMKWYKFGITRTFDQLSVQIRAGRLTRDEAIAQLRQQGLDLPVADIENFCAFLGVTPEWFWQTTEKFRNPAIWKKRDGQWVMPEFLIKDWLW